MMLFQAFTFISHASRLDTNTQHVCCADGQHAYPAVYATPRQVHADELCAAAVAVAGGERPIAAVARPELGHRCGLQPDCCRRCAATCAVILLPEMRRPSTYLLFHCGPPCSPARAGPGRARARGASARRLLHRPGSGERPMSAPCRPANALSLALARAGSVRACRLRARPVGDGARAAQAPLGPSRRSARTWPTTTCSPTCSEA